jgi:hypothetical protein
MPTSHVTTFQTIAAKSAAKMTPLVTVSGSTMPFPTVSATVRPKKRKAMKLKNEAQKTARDGRRTRVDTIVAIEFAAS